MVTDSSEVSARNGRQKHPLVVRRASQKRAPPTLRARIRRRDVPLALAYRRLRTTRPRLLVSVHTVEKRIIVDDKAIHVSVDYVCDLVIFM